MEMEYGEELTIEQAKTILDSFKAKDYWEFEDKARELSLIYGVRLYDIDSTYATYDFSHLSFRGRYGETLLGELKRNYQVIEKNGYLFMSGFLIKSDGCLEKISLKSRRNSTNGEEKYNFVQPISSLLYLDAPNLVVVKEIRRVWREMML